MRFADGLSGTIDLASGLRGPIFAPLRDPSLFALLRIVGGALAWPNGADWAPESLYDLLRAQNGADTQPIGGGDGARPAHPVAMPEISRFFGVVIRMLANDHAPPHFHAYYGEFEASVSIRDAVVSGRFPGRALRMVLEWRDLHEEALMENWERLRSGELPHPIPPLG